MPFKFIYRCLLVVLIASCNSESSSNKITVSDSLIKRIAVKLQITDSVHFFNNCSELMNGSSSGGIQGVNTSKDSTGYFCFVECFDCKESYEVVLSYKGGIEKRKFIGYQKIEASFNSGCQNLFNDFDCFAFVLKMRDPEKQKDMHAMNIDFPVNVKIYKRISGDTWQFIKKIKAKSFEEYSRAELNTIYGLD